MADLPLPLLARLGPVASAALSSTVDAIGEELASVYAENVRDHSEARGDNAQLFGQKIWYHGDHRITLRLNDHPHASVTHRNGSYRVELTSLSIGVYKLGDTRDDDIHECFPDDSPTKRAYAERNVEQLRLFSPDDPTPELPLPPEVRYGLNDLIVGHFGNPRDGLVKWYVGAPTTDERGVRRWAWIHAQELSAATAAPRTRSTSVPTFDPSQVEPLQIRPRAKREAS